MTELKIGDPIPNFEVKSDIGRTVTRDDLLGSAFIIYFYPKDNTPGCTKEACDFTDKMERFNDLNLKVLGVSPDSLASHQKFKEEHNLSFTLLSDPDRSMAEAFQAIKEEKKIVRSTFLINEEGIIQWIEKPVNVEGHIRRVLDAVEKRSGFEKIKER